MKNTLVIGSTCTDVVIRVDHLPTTGEDLDIESQKFSLGGCAYNVFHALQLFNSPSMLFSPIGSGIFGDFIRARFAEAGVTTAAPAVQEKNGCCYCFVDPDGERTFVCEYGAEYVFKREWFNSLNAEEIGSVYICGLEIERAGGNDIISYLEAHPEFNVFFAPGPRIDAIPTDLFNRILNLHPVLHLNADESLRITGKNNLRKAVADLYSWTNNTVYVTLGARGVLIADKDGLRTIESKPAEVADTIGAGDSHIGALIANLNAGFSPDEAAARANIFSAAVVATPGAILPKEAFDKLKF